MEKKATIKQRDIRHTLKQRREELGLARVEVAEIVGVTEQTIRNWEEGESFPSVWYLPSIEEAYKTMRELIRWPFDAERERIVREGDPDGPVVYARIVVISDEKYQRQKAIPLEIEEAIANNDKDRLSALVQELKQMNRSSL